MAKKYRGDFQLNKVTNLLTKEACPGRDLSVVKRGPRVPGSGGACGPCIITHSAEEGNALTREQMEAYLGHKLGDKSVRTTTRSVAIKNENMLKLIRSFEEATKIHVYRVWEFWNYEGGQHLEYVALQAYDADQVYLSRKMESDWIWHGGSTFNTEQFNKLRKSYMKAEEEAK